MSECDKYFFSHFFFLTATNTVAIVATYVKLENQQYIFPRFLHLFVALRKIEQERKNDFYDMKYLFFNDPLTTLWISISNMCFTWIRSKNLYHGNQQYQKNPKQSSQKNHLTDVEYRNWSLLKLFYMKLS